MVSYKNAHGNRRCLVLFVSFATQYTQSVWCAIDSFVKTATQVNEGWMLLRHHNRQHRPKTDKSKALDTAWSPLKALNHLVERIGNRPVRVTGPPAVDSPARENSGEQSLKSARAVQTAMRLFARAARRGQLHAMKVMGDVMLHGLQNASMFRPILKELPKLSQADYDGALRRYRANITAAFRLRLVTFFELIPSAFGTPQFVSVWNVMSDSCIWNHSV